MKSVVNITEFRNNIADYIDRVIYKDENIILKKGGKIVAKVTSYQTEEVEREEHPLMQLVGILCNEEAEEMMKDLKSIRKNSKREIKKTMKLFDK